jgi:NTP pyrophosphatase (non-canonical NTP hydrolase)
MFTTFAEYESVVRSTNNYQPGERPIIALALAGEAGETCNLIKKSIYRPEAIEDHQVLDELGDILWYLSALADSYGHSLLAVAQRNAEKVTRRHNKGTTYNQREAS